MYPGQDRVKVNGWRTRSQKLRCQNTSIILRAVLVISLMLALLDLWFTTAQKNRFIKINNMFVDWYLELFGIVRRISDKISFNYFTINNYKLQYHISPLLTALGVYTPELDPILVMCFALLLNGALLPSSYEMYINY